MNHICTLDDRNQCEQCETAKRINQLTKGLSIAEIMADRIPNNFEFPDPYEMGLMESGEWN